MKEKIIEILNKYTTNAIDDNCYYNAEDMIDFAKYVLKEKLTLSGVVARMLVCVDGMVPNLTKGNKYEMLEETSRHYNLIDDNGNDVLIGKSYMRELK